MIRKKSIALILSLMVIIVLAALSASIFSISISDNNRTNRYVKSTQAFWLAEAGAQKALWELNYGGGIWTGWSDVSGSKLISVNLGTGYYAVTVNDPAGNPVITVIGHDSKYGIERKIEVTVTTQTNSPFTYAGFGKKSLAIHGNGETDSYDSSLGAYGGSNIGYNGDVGTNGTSSGAISLSGNATVNGDAGTGLGGTVSLIGGASITGTTSDTTNETLSSVTIPSSLSSLAGSGSYTVSGSQTLTSGDYKYSSISISGNDQLTLQGTVNLYLTSSTNAFSTSGNGQLIIDSGAQVTIYTDGKVSLAGNGVVNNTSLPQNFLLYSTYSGHNGITISGNGDLYGAIYAPNAEIEVTGNGDSFGSLIGNTITITGNGDIHYDEALQNVGSTSTTYASGNWKEQENPYPL